MDWSNEVLYFAWSKHNLTCSFSFVTNRKVLHHSHVSSMPNGVIMSSCCSCSSSSLNVFCNVQATWFRGLVWFAIWLCLQWKCAIETPNSHEHIFCILCVTVLWILHLPSYQLLIAGMQGNSLFCSYCYQWPLDYLHYLNLEYCLCLYCTFQSYLFPGCCLCIATYFLSYYGFGLFVFVCPLCCSWLLIYLGSLCLACLTELDHFLVLLKAPQFLFIFVINCYATNA